MAGRKDVEVLAYIKGVHDPTKRQLFLVNRLGFSTSVQCKNCGYILTCPECGTPLRYHRRSKRLECHRCGYIASIPDKCPRCESLSLEPSGLGIERLELQLGKKALRSVKDLDHNTVISTTKVFRICLKESLMNPTTFQPTQICPHLCLFLRKVFEEHQLLESVDKNRRLRLCSIPRH